MTEENLDVNQQEAASAPEEASPAEAQNTEEPQETPSHIPYDRFREVNEAKRQLQTQLEEIQGKYKPFEENADKYSVYDQFDQLLTQRPELLQAMQQVMSQQNGQQLTPEQIAAMRAEAGTASVVQSSYEDRFDSWFKNGNYPDALRDYALNQAVNKLSQVNPNWQWQFDGKAAQKVLQEVGQSIDTMQKAWMASHVTDKQKQAVPSSGDNQSPALQQKELTSQSQRAQALASLMKEQLLD